MCGIAGILGCYAPEFSQRVNPHLAHRGSDDQGIWEQEEVTLVHHRLAIQDLSDSGHQPMVSACGRYVIVFNGEIYNVQSLRQQLTDLGDKVKSHSDTEVLLLLYAHYGKACLERLRGMFAFVIWDIQDRQAFFARDPLGIKPLYFVQGSSGELAFASELRALLASGVFSPSLNIQSVYNFLRTGSVPEPQTIISEIQVLSAGCYGIWESGRLVIETYWQPDYSPDFAITPTEAITITRQAVEETVQAHLVGDVPVGLFLSGGLDSSSLLALAKQPIETFSIGFSETQFDESNYSAAVAKFFNANHHTMILGAKQAGEWFPDFLDAIDQPTLDGFNTFCISRLAQEQGLKVVLSGLGGDELFGGYPSFKMVPRLQKLRSLGKGVSPILGAAFQQKSSGSSQRLADLFKSAPTFDQAYSCYRGIFSSKEAGALLKYWNLSTEFPQKPLDINLQTEFNTSADLIAWLETSRYMRNQLLRDSDIFSMAWGLELRVPFVDQYLLDKISHIPASIRLAKGKKILVDAVPELPSWLLNRPKQGFTFPFQIWLNTFVKECVNLPNTPKSLDCRSWYRQWSLLVLQYWLKSYLGISLG